MGLAQRLGGFFEKRETAHEVDALERRVGVAPKLVHELLQNRSDIRSYDISDIRGNPVREELFKKLLSALHDGAAPGRSDELLEALRTGASTPDKDRDIRESIEEYKARCALAETVVSNLDRDMVGHAMHLSPALKQAIGGMADEKTTAEAVKEYAWRHAMGDARELSNVQNLALHLDAIRASMERPERGAAIAYIDKRLAKKNMNFNEFRNLVDPSDPGGSVARIRAVIEERNYSRGWRRVFKWTGAGRREAERLRAFALDPASGGLAAAEAEIERSIGDMGAALALSVIPHPGVRAELWRAALGEEEGGTVPFRFMERNRVRLDSAKRLLDIEKHMDRRWFWNEYRTFVKDVVRREGGTALTDPSLTDAEAEDYANRFLTDFRGRLNALYGSSHILGPALKGRISRKVNDFEIELLAPPAPGKIPADLA